MADRKIWGRVDWRWVSFGVTCLVSLPIFKYMFDCMCAKFSDPREDMSHGWLIPVACLFFIWSKRDALRAASSRPSWRGFFYVAVSLGIFWIGNNGEQYRICQAAFSLLIWAVPYAIWGQGVARLMVFPAVFFLFTIPFAFLDFFTIKLRMFAAGIATGLLNGMGLSVTRVGTALHSTVGAGFSLDVADPCSGLRSLFAMMALTTAYAYYSQKTLIGKWILFLSAVPIAVIGNICRIASICVVAWLFGQQAATGFYHDYSGYVVFLVGVLLMMKTGSILSRYIVKDGRWSRWLFRPDTASGCAPLNAARRRAGPAVAVAVAFLAVWGLKCLMGPPIYESADFVASVLPERVGDFVGDTPWYCQNEQCLQVAMETDLCRQNKRLADGGYACPACGGALGRVALGEQKLMNGDARLLKRTYRAPDGLTYSVSLVMTGRSHSTIHRPELCLPTQGFSMEKAEIVRLNLRGAKPIEARKITLRMGNSPPFNLIYWFSSRTYQTCVHSKRVLSNVWDRSVHNQISRWFMVSIQVSSSIENEEAENRLENFLSEFYPQVYLTKHD